MKKSVVKLTEHYQALQLVDNIDAFKELIEQSGLPNLFLGHKSFPFHWKEIISAALEFYDDSVGAFVFNDNVTLHYGLEDIAFITGLRIDGDAVCGIQTDDSAQSLIAEHISLPPDIEVRLTSNGSISLCWLQEMLGRALSPEAHAKLFFLLCIGCVISPDNTANGVGKMYVSLLGSIDNINRLSVGGAMLASFFFAARKFSNRAPGPFFPFFIFLLERIPSLYSFLIRKDISSESALRDFPLMKGWVPLLNKPSRDMHHRKSLEDCLNFLKNLSPSAVNFRPYERLPADFLPGYLKEQLPVISARTCVLNMNKVGYHLPSPRQLVQNEETLQMRVKELEEREPLPKFKDKGLNGAKSNGRRDWREVHAGPLSLWERRMECLIVGSNIADTEDPSYRFEESIDTSEINTTWPNYSDGNSSPGFEANSTGPNYSSPVDADTSLDSVGPHEAAGDDEILNNRTPADAPREKKKRRGLPSPVMSPVEGKRRRRNPYHLSGIYTGYKKFVTVADGSRERCTYSGAIFNENSSASRPKS